MFEALTPTRYRSARFRTKNNLPTLEYFESFCQNFDVTQAIIASEHGNAVQTSLITDNSRDPTQWYIWLAICKILLKVQTLCGISVFPELSSA